MNAIPTDIDGYLTTLPEDARATLEELRRSIKAVAPDAVETISYGMPTFKYKGRPLTYFGAWRNHCALYGLRPDVGELAGYDVSKGTIRFPPGKPPPEALVKKLVSVRMAAIETATAERKRSGARPRTSA